MLTENGKKVLEILADGFAPLVDLEYQDIEYFLNRELMAGDGELARLIDDAISKRRRLGQILSRVRTLDRQLLDLEREFAARKQQIETDEGKKRELEYWEIEYTNEKERLKRAQAEVGTNIGYDRLRRKIEELEKNLTSLKRELPAIREVVTSGNRDFKVFETYFERKRQEIDNETTALQEEKTRLQKEFEEARVEKEKFEHDVGNKKVTREELQDILDGLSKEKLIHTREYADRRHERLIRFYRLSSEGKQVLILGYEHEAEAIGASKKWPGVLKVYHEIMVTEARRASKREASELKCAIEITDENALRSQDHKKKQYPDLSCELSARGETMSYFIEADMGSEDPEELFNKVKGHEKLTMILCQKIDRIKKIVNTFDRLIRELDEKEREQQSSKMLFKLHSDFIRHGLWDKWIKLRSSATPLRNFRDVILEEVYLEEVLDLPILAPLYGNRGEGSI